MLPVGDGLIRPVSGLFITIGRSGERKSATDDLAMRAVRIREEEKRTVYAIEHRAWQDAHEAWEVERKSILSKKGEKDAKRADLEALGAEPEAPLVPILVMAEPTIE